MDTTIIRPHGKQPGFLWIAIPVLIVLTAAFAVIWRTSAAPASQSQQKIASPSLLVTQELVAAKPSPSPISIAAASAPQPENQAAARKSCDCETAETELPDTCPNNACRQCKATCGLPSH
jgi:hypothetical protein